MTYLPVDNIPDDICHLPAEISNKVSLSCHLHVIHTSSVRRLHVVRHEISTPKYFQRAENSSAKNPTSRCEVSHFLSATGHPMFN